MKLKRSEYLQVVGLLALASTHSKALEDIEAAICKLVGEKPHEGAGEHVGDAIYAPYTADQMLERIDAQRKRDAKVKKK